MSLTLRFLEKLLFKKIELWVLVYPVSASWTV